ncbi:hypothetical protein GT347_03315 [Xylophilus rhododendri]|uniref:Uncharacterized protein n=1 Tax=Xylophilus rhododendri TaxID=2697032 RepID=A0A857J2E2_9BURK|nr:hypothetical protein [Xylophilus rhododendri]QHI97098.1 hypothetical protein GT347_03315 [Xylophilus rhododendri]
MIESQALHICSHCFGIVGARTAEPPHSQLQLTGITYFGDGITGRQTNAVYQFQCISCGLELMRDRNPAEADQVWLPRDTCAHH